MQLIRWAIERFPKHGDVATVMALVAEASDERDEAAQAARRALVIDPNNRQATTVLRNLAK